MCRLVVISGLVGALLTATGVAFLIAYIGDETDRIAGLSAWSEFATALATVSLVVGGIWAAVGVFRQASEARHSRETALRPIVVVSGAWSKNGLIEVQLKNVGPGAALQVHVDGWDRYGETPDAFEGHIAEYDAFIKQERELIDLTVASIDGGLAVLGADDSTEIALWDPVVPSETQYKTKIIGRIYYHVKYRDIFGNEFTEPPIGDPLPFKSFRARTE